MVGPFNLMASLKYYLFFIHKKMKIKGGVRQFNITGEVGQLRGELKPSMAHCNKHMPKRKKKKYSSKL